MATDGTQYLIELAAKFGGGDAAVSKLADLGDRMLKAGATAKELEAASKAVGTELEKAGTAAKAAADLVAEGESKYAAAERAAERAAKAVEKIGAMAEQQTGKLQAALDTGDAKKIKAAEDRIWALVRRQQDAVTKSNEASAALKSEAAALDTVKAAATAAAAKHTDLTKGLANVKAAADKAGKAEAAAAGTGKINEMAEAMGKLGGPAGFAGQKVLGVATGFQKLRVAMGVAGPYVAIAVAIIAIASAAALAAVAVGNWAVRLSDANRSQGLLAQGIARSVKDGDALNAKINSLSKMVPQSREELVGMADDLAKTGLRGKALSDALETAAVKAAKLKWGPEFGKQMLSLDVQARRFGENISDTFGGLKVEGLLSGMSTLVALFDSSTASGRALKFLFESIFQPLVDGAVGVIPKIERLFLHAVILALKAYIALKPWSEEIAMVGQLLLFGAGVLAGVFAAAVALVVVNVVAMGAAIAAVAAALGAAIYGLYQFALAIPQLLSGAVEWMADLGTRMIDGLVNAITGGATAVVDAISGTITGAIDAAKNLLGIASPSKVFAGMGKNTAAGFAEGVDAGAGDAQGSLAALVEPPAAGGARGLGGGGGGVTLSIGQIVVSGADGKEQANDLINQFVAWLESEGITIGGGEVPA